MQLSLGVNTQNTMRLLSLYSFVLCILDDSCSWNIVEMVHKGHEKMKITLDANHILWIRSFFPNWFINEMKIIVTTYWSFVRDHQINFPFLSTHLILHHLIGTTDCCHYDFSFILSIRFQQVVSHFQI